MLLCGVLASLSGGCAVNGPTAGREPAPRIREDESPMSQRRMELIFLEQVDKVEGSSGMLHSVVDGVRIYLLSDPENDRMRMMSQIAPADRLRRRFLNVLLEANFDVTLDARYAISEGVVYGVYRHPISRLTRADIETAFTQVLALAKNFGTSFSATPASGPPDASPSPPGAAGSMPGEAGGR